MGAEEHLHGRSGSGITEKDLIRVIMQEYFWLFKIGHSRQKEKENSSQEHKKHIFFMYNWYPANVIIKFFYIYNNNEQKQKKGHWCTVLKNFKIIL